jgi:hypothetical protein
MKLKHKKTSSSGRANAKVSQRAAEHKCCSEVALQCLSYYRCLFSVWIVRLKYTVATYVLLQLHDVPHIVSHVCIFCCTTCLKFTEKYLGTIWGGIKLHCVNFSLLLWAVSNKRSVVMYSERSLHKAGIWSRLRFQPARLLLELDVYKICTKLT